MQSIPDQPMQTRWPGKTPVNLERAFLTLGDVPFFALALATPAQTFGATRPARAETGFQARALTGLLGWWDVW